VSDSNMVAYEWRLKENREKFQDNILKPRFEIGSFQIKREKCTLSCRAVVKLCLTLFWSFWPCVFQACVLVPRTQTKWSTSRLW